MDYAFAQTGVGAGRFNKIYDYSTNNRSFYDGINLQLQKRMSSKFMFRVSNVTSWSRAWGGFPVASYGGSGLAVTPEQQFQPNEFGYTNYDERNRFVASGLVPQVRPSVGLTWDRCTRQLEGLGLVSLPS